MTLKPSMEQIIKPETAQKVQEFAEHLMNKCAYNEYIVVIKVLEQIIDELTEVKKREEAAAGRCTHDKIVNITTLGDTNFRQMCMRCQKVFETSFKKER